jgi:glycosyltransferase involved in cell wall biosynthesis
MEVFPRQGLLGPLSRVRSLIKAMKRDRIQVAHCWLPTANIVGKLAAWRARVPVIIHSERLAKTPRLRLSGIALRLLRGKTTCFLGNSKAVRDMLVRTGLGIEERTRIIHNGIDIDAWQQVRTQLDRKAKREELGLDPERFLVVMVGRLVLQKNYHCFIRAASALLKKRPGAAQFALVGDGELYDVLTDFADELGLSDDVKLLGVRRDVPEVLACADASVLCSYAEGLPNAVIESMAAGVPVVGTDVLGTNEVIRDHENGLLAPNDDPESLAGALEELLDSATLREEMSAGGLAALRARFSMESMAQAHMELYEELLGR